MLLSIRLLKHIPINAVCVNTDYLILTNGICYSFLLYPKEEKKQSGLLNSEKGCCDTKKLQ